MDAYVGEIRMIACDYPPQGWAICNGQMLNTSEYQDLFSLFGWKYGGRGATFGVPDLRGRIPVHCNDSWSLGQSEGNEQETLTERQMPSHNHAFQASKRTPCNKKVANNIICNTGDVKFYRKQPSSPARETSLCEGAVDYAGGSEAHSNMMPYQCINFIVCLRGAFPPRPDKDGK
jgi:microcystin-dependent protein